MKSRCKEPSRNKAEAYRVYGEHLFRRSDAADALRFAKANDRYVVYEIDGRGRVTEVTDRKQYFKVKAFYDENNREVRRILGNGNKQDYTYDEAGRLLGIVETDSNWAIIRAEGYGYDGEGRRIFTADEKGNLTRYVYDEQYRIKEVLYPASEELRAYHREEAKETRLFIDEGAASHRREIMNPVELAQIRATFSRLVGARTSNLGSLVNSIQLVWTEQYTYDANGNIATKTTPYGTIHYSYDKENRLLTRGAVHYTYDEEGNLLREEQNDYYLKRYEYAGFNRMEVSDIINYQDNTHVITDYRYDSFGRRIHTAERTKTGMRTIYDGLSFEVVKEAETFLGTRGITSSATGEANLNNYNPQVPQNGGPNNTAPSYPSDHTKGTRYYYIPNNAQGSQTRNNGETTQSAPSYGSDHTKGTRYYYIPDNAQGAQIQHEGSASNTAPPYPSDHTRGTRYYYIPDNPQSSQAQHSAIPADRTKGVRTYLYLNGERVAINNLYNTNHGQYYYGSDILGSVKFITGQGGQELKRIEYDVFGGIYKGNSPYGLETGYTGKPYDAVTGLSDYGFRDYSPAHARFITEDPIRDGKNWFAYVGNNPVNWVDPWGLSASDGNVFTKLNTIVSTVQTIADGAGGSLAAMGQSRLIQPYTEFGNSLGVPAGTITQLPIRTLPDPKLTGLGDTFKFVGKGLLATSAVLGVGDAVYTGVQQKSFIAGAKRFVRNTASTAAGVVVGGIVSGGSIVLSGGVATVPGTLAGAAAGSVASYYADKVFEWFGW